MEYSIYIMLFIAGLLGGFIGGLIGIGGGIIFVLILPQVFQIIGVMPSEVPQFSVANSLFAIVFSSIASSITLFRDKNLFPREVFIIGSVSLVTATLVISYFVNTPAFDKNTFNVVVIGLMLFMLFRTLRSARATDTTDYREISPIRLGALGLLSGTIAPISGLGGGIIIIPIINGVFKLNVRVANSISLGVIGITSIVATGINLMYHPASTPSGFTIGLINFPVVLCLTIGVIVASPFGVSFSKSLKPATINYIFAIFICLSILKKLSEIFL
jgi:uncharacterized protein